MIFGACPCIEGGDMKKGSHTSMSHNRTNNDELQVSVKMRVNPNLEEEKDQNSKEENK